MEYTVHLTAERDYHFTQLEELKKEINKEKLKKKSSYPSGNQNNGSDGQVQQQQLQTVKKEGFPFIVVLIVAFLSFLLARYTS